MTSREINNVKFFLDWFNKKNKTDYTIDDSFNEENSHVDVMAKSKTTRKILNIQNTAYRSGNIYKYGTSNIPNIMPKIVLGVSMDTKQKKESIIKCINSKETGYAESVVKDLILIIEVTIPSLKPKEIKKMFKGGYKSNFKGIYFVSLPVMLANIEDEYQKNGYVYSLKECAEF
jgi:hypothetical protein